MRRMWRRLVVSLIRLFRSDIAGIVSCCGCVYDRDGKGSMACALCSMGSEYERERK